MDGSWFVSLLVGPNTKIIGQDIRSPQRLNLDNFVFLWLLF